MMLQIDSINNQITEWVTSLDIAPKWDGPVYQLVVLFIILLLAVLSDYACRFFISHVLRRIIRSTRITWDDLLLDRKVLNRFALVVPAVLVYFLLPLAFPQQPLLLSYLLKFCLVYIIAVILRFFSALFNILFEIYSEKEKFKNRPLKGLFQTLQVILFFVGFILIISVVIGRSPMTLFAGLGASAAILSLVFKDTIMGFVSGIQLSANDMLRPGDWITMDKHGINGRVIEVTLNTVKIRNFDNTILTVPPYSLVNESFQNWRGMEESEGRRVKRSINIDVNSIRFSSSELLIKLSQIELFQDVLSEYLGGKNSKQTKVSNLKLFRIYIERYIQSLPTTNSDMLYMVRYLEMTDKGLPVEFYFFSAQKVWVDYEHIVADFFDHALAMLPVFELKLFQSPSGSDLDRLVRRLEN